MATVQRFDTHAGAGGSALPFFVPARRHFWAVDRPPLAILVGLRRVTGLRRGARYGAPGAALAVLKVAGLARAVAERRFEGSVDDSGFRIRISERSIPLSFPAMAWGHVTPSGAGSELRIVVAPDPITAAGTALLWLMLGFFPAAFLADLVGPVGFAAMPLVPIVAGTLSLSLGAPRLLAALEQELKSVE